MEENIRETENIELGVSRSGIPCLGESGGGLSNMGLSYIVCNQNYNRKKAIFVFTGGALACGTHAVIPVCVGDHFVECYRRHNECEVTVFVITSIKGNQATCQVESHATVTPDYKGNKAVEAAIAKSLDDHCRVPYYIISPQKK